MARTKRKKAEAGKKPKAKHLPAKGTAEAKARLARLELRAAKRALDRKALKDARHGLADMRRDKKLERRKGQMGRRIGRSDGDWDRPIRPGLVGKLELPKSKYKSYFEFADNAGRREKKLEIEYTIKSTPPPGYAFIRIGNPTFTDACKELSRARDAMVFIVSANDEKREGVGNAVSRIGYHFRESIVDDAVKMVGETVMHERVYRPDQIEPIPETQEEINEQADAAIRDLFPRIPNTDRQMVIEHAFKKGGLFLGQPMVGLASDIPLSRRVQLAVLAHIRHTHTRYDRLLREADYISARKTVEPICLSFLVKWRGDDETGRDQLEEILREVVIITDSEAEESDADADQERDSEEDEDETEDESDASSVSLPSVSCPRPSNQRQSARPQVQVANDKKAQRGFQRYRAVWDEAQRREHRNPSIPGSSDVPLQASSSLFQSAVQAPYGNDIGSRIHPSTLPEHIVHEQNLFRNSQDVVRQESGFYRQPLIADKYPREDLPLMPLQERQNPPHFGTALYSAQDQTPRVVVRASPNHGLQDMLVPSIEAASSDAVGLSHPDGQHQVKRGWHESSHHVPQRSLHSPQQHQQIVVIEDSPVIKRRRIVHDEDASRSRLLPSRDQDLYSAASRSGSYLPSALATQPRDLVAHERLQPKISQGMFRDEPLSMIGMISRSGERLPVYDAPPGSRAFDMPYDRYRRIEDGHITMQREDLPIQRQIGAPQGHFENRSEGSYTRLPVHDEMRLGEYERARQPRYESSMGTVQRPLPPAFPLSSQVIRPHESGREPTFLSSTSQFRVESPLYRTRHGFTGAPESGLRSFAQQEIVPQLYEARPAETFTTLHSGEARSPARYNERPVRERQQYGNGQPTQERYQTLERPSPQRVQAPESDSPVYVRTLRRPVIEID